MSETTTTLQAVWTHLDSFRGEERADLWKTLLHLARGEIRGELSPEVIEFLRERAPSAELDEFTTPPLISDLVAGLADIFKPASVLDPMCGSGVALYKVQSVSTPQTVDGVDIDAESCEIARQTLKQHGRVQQGNIFDPRLSLHEKYDLIIADPPLNTRIEKERLPESLRAEGLKYVAQYLVIWACRRLSKDGALAVVMGPSALNQTSFVEAVNAEGCRIRASFHVPAGTRSNTAIASQVLVVQHGAQEAIFVGQISNDDKHQERLLKNFKRHKSDRHPSLGRVCELERFIGYEALEAEHRLQVQVRRTNLIAHRFGDLLIEKSHHRRDVDDNGAQSASFGTLFLPQEGLRFYADRTEMPERVNNYTRFELDADKAYAQYLLRWFETDLGETALRAAGANSFIGLAHITSSILERLTCYLPPVHEQQEILDALRQLERVRTEIQEIEDGCWTGSYSGEELLHRAQTVNQEDRYEDWIESLPYPLASILWRHKVSGEDPRIRYRILLQFFEALAEFLATIHLSAFTSHELTWRAHQDKLLNILERQRLTLERATFGTWKVVVESLSADARKMVENNEQASLVHNMYSTYQTQWLQALCDSRIATILSKANSMRNTDDAHGGAMGEAQADQIEQELLSLVEQVRAVFGRGWQRYELIQADKIVYTDGRFTFQAPRLMGTRNQFERVERSTLSPMDNGQLYLLADSGSHGLKLLPFVKVMASPSKVANACYFYNREERDGQRFVSYHFEEEPTVCDHFEDTALAMKRLTTISTLPGMEDEV